MNSTPFPAPPARVASLHLHPTVAGEPLRDATVVEVVTGKGIQGEPRYFGRTISATGQPSRRQITLIEREVLSDHAAALGLAMITPGGARSNIETSGVNLRALIGKKVRIGEAVLFLYEARTPCQKMDAICQGLRARMENGRQGALAEVVTPGTIRVGDAIEECG